VDIHRQVSVVTVPLTGTKLVAVCHQACGHPVSAPGSSLYMSAIVALLASCSQGGTIIVVSNCGVCFSIYLVCRCSYFKEVCSSLFVW